MKKGYYYIDIFRFVAAILVIYNHTAPFVNINYNLNYFFIILTRIAVPFFFVTSGYFLIDKYRKDNSKIMNYIKKIGLYYLIAILIYIPLNIYDGTFSSYINDLPLFFSDFFFNGTVYHLWFLPASIIGFIIADRLVYKGYKKALIISSILYIIGLFGDSYYSFIINVPFITKIYDMFFTISTYTRNGIFMAPLFFIIGSYIKNKKSKIKPNTALLLSLLCLILMICEGFILNRTYQRWDSMYIMLIPFIYFFYIYLSNFRNGRIDGSSRITLVVYIIHIYVVMAIRIISKITSIPLFSNNIFVFIITVIVSFIIGYLFNKLFPEKNKKIIKDRAWIEINLNNLDKNISEIKKNINPKTKIMAVVKAEAYGHGLYEIATHLERNGINAFAVATIDEAIELRKYGIDSEILVLGYTPISRSKDLMKYKITQTLIDYDYSIKLNDQNLPILCNLKIDTGMHRLGFDYLNIERIKETLNMNNLKITGIFTHLSTSDGSDRSDIEFANLQIKRFNQIKEEIKKINNNISYHIQSSYGLLNYPELEGDYVRMGITLFGVKTDIDDITKLNLDIKPVLELKSKVVLLRNIQKGESVSYSRNYIAKEDTKIAIVPIGYADGYPRNLSNEKIDVLIRGKRCKVIGKICMDQLAVEVKDVDDITVDDIVTLIGEDHNEFIDVTEVAKKSQSISNEILSRLGSRLKIYIKEA